MWRNSWVCDHEGSRHNNFTIIRLVFAYFVVVGHAYPIAGAGSDPLSRLIQPYMWIGELAVQGFFAISGFLICASFVKRPWYDFILARALRLYPALIAYLVFAIFVIGPLATTLPLRDYFADPALWPFFWNNATIWRLGHNLPGVFANHPMPYALNGSLWTLQVELLCYATVFFVGVFGVLEKRWRANLMIAVLFVTGAYAYPQLPVFGDYERFFIPASTFLFGATVWFNRQYIPLNWPLFLAVVALPFVTTGLPYWMPIFGASLTYAIFFIAYRFPVFNMDRYGDFSYGVYIYGWPICSLVWWQGQSGAVNALLGVPLVTILAIGSWFLIEKPALRLKTWLSSSVGRFHAPADPRVGAAAE